MPSSWHRSLTTVAGLPIAALAMCTFAGVIVWRRPPTRPRALAAARPALVRSEIREASKSARAAKIRIGTLTIETLPPFQGACRRFVDVDASDLVA